MRPQEIVSSQTQTPRGNLGVFVLIISMVSTIPYHMGIAKSTSPL